MTQGTTVTLNGTEFVLCNKAEGDGITDFAAQYPYMVSIYEGQHSVSLHMNEKAAKEMFTNLGKMLDIIQS